MSSGRTHERNNMALLPFFMLIAIFLTSNPWLIVCFVTGYVLSTYYLSPDLDTFSNAYRRFGRLRFIWRPYQMMFSHRGLSHFVLIGTLSRLVYLLAVFLGSYYLLAWLLSQQSWAEIELHTAGITNLMKNPAYIMELPIRNHLIWLFSGLLLSDMIHLFFDQLSSFAKRWLF